jgi:hypothetical protein
MGTPAGLYLCMPPS